MDNAAIKVLLLAQAGHVAEALKWFEFYFLQKFWILKFQISEFPNFISKLSSKVSVSEFSKVSKFQRFRV